jgi:monothiol glutaredoxin
MLSRAGAGARMLLRRPLAAGTAPCVAARAAGCAGARLAAAPACAGTRALATTPRDDGSETHPDFAAKNKAALSDDEEIQQFLKQAVKENEVLLFMKGTANAPRCGFSAQTVRILQATGVDFSSADVLVSAPLREGLKKFSEWPTFPQLYVNGEFVGGCDIVTEMSKNGELSSLLKPILDKQAKEAPTQ